MFRGKFPHFDGIVDNLSGEGFPDAAVIFDNRTSDLLNS